VPRSRYDPTEPLDRTMDWSILAQRQMSASLVVVVHIRPQDSPQVSFPEDEWSSRAAGFHRRALPEPYVSLSTHTAPSIRPFA
jgi:hypothetical protein